VKRERSTEWVDDDGVRYDRATARRCRTASSYLTLDREGERHPTTRGLTVPQGHFFMMGDNRDNSTDSRVLVGVGYVPFENLVGRAEMIFFSVEEGASPPGASGNGPGRCAGTAYSTSSRA
jgi:signal peptidase I